jgi:predicted PurR-regulated permease PerM
MSELVDVSAARPRRRRDPAKTLELLATLFFVAFAIAFFYVGRDVLVPIAIAVLLSFVLSQPIMLLRRLGLNRTIAVAAVVVASLIIALAVSAALTQQVSELAADVPKYQATINGKIGKVRDLVSANALVEKGARALKSIGELGRKQPESAAEPASSKSVANEAGAANTPRPVPVEVQQPATTPFAVLQTIAGTALSPIETTALVVIFVIFILLQREDLRNRFIRLVGPNDLQRTTVAMNDAAGRLSRFFLAQTLVNATFGVVVAAGLYVIGVPGPILFGLVAFLMRFVPYVGVIIAAAFPVALAASVDPGWAMALEALAIFIIFELIVGNIVEPFLYGHNTGLSPIAVVVAATFWTWLWGPIGLVLSTPLTVCLVVLGRHVEQLSFLDVILGDAPALSPVEHFYQRLLVGDAAEIADQAERFLKSEPLTAYYDEVALHGLLMAQDDVSRGVLDEARLARINETIEEVIENLSDYADEEPEAPQAAPEPPPYADLGAEGPAQLPEDETLPGIAPPAVDGPRKAILCVAGRNLIDQAAAGLLAQILEKHGMPAKIEPPELLTIGGILHLPGTGAQIICLSYVGADVSAARVRFAIRRLRRRLPEAKIIAGFWASEADAVSLLCGQTRADTCPARLADAVAFCLEQTKVTSASPQQASPASPIGPAHDAPALQALHGAA